MMVLAADRVRDLEENKRQESSLLRQLEDLEVEQGEVRRLAETAQDVEGENFHDLAFLEELDLLPRSSQENLLLMKAALSSFHTALYNDIKFQQEKLKKRVKQIDENLSELKVKRVQLESLLEESKEETDGN